MIYVFKYHFELVDLNIFDVFQSMAIIVLIDT